MSTQSPAEDTFSTTDLYLAAYLQCAGAQMLRPNKSPTGRLTFVFDTSVINIEELKLAWASNQGKVSAHLYADSIKNLKHLCHMG